MHGTFVNSMMDSSSTHHQSCKENKAPVYGGIHNLPEEIIAEILVKLPVKSLLRFRCVSRSWLASISSQHLIKAHLNNSMQDMNLSNYRIMLTIGDDLKHCPLNLLLHEPWSIDACSIDYPKGNPKSNFRGVGSCNGLICLAIDEKDLLLWNPSTRQWRELPPRNFDIGQAASSSHVQDCFGFLERGDDYKVVSIISVFEKWGDYKSMVQIYSLKTDCWKRVQGEFKGGVAKNDGCEFASGKLHWLAYVDGLWDIISFDMESEVFGVVKQPNYGHEDCGLVLGVLGECICVLCDHENSADLWVLNEYGVKESWTKIVVLPYPDASGFPYSAPLFTLPNGGILFTSWSYFVVHNLKDNSAYTWEINNIKLFEEVNIYVESLVSPLSSGRLKVD